MGRAKLIFFNHINPLFEFYNGIIGINKAEKFSYHSMIFRYKETFNEELLQIIELILLLFILTA